MRMGSYVWLLLVVCNVCASAIVRDNRKLHRVVVVYESLKMFVFVFQPELLDNVALNLHRIDKDVHRCDRNNSYFTSQANLDKLRNIMCT